MSALDADALCRECGLCCDGTVFGSVVVRGEERARVERVGLRVVGSEEACSMAQPCSALEGCLCSVYADRPTACRQYECALRERVGDGTTRLEEARERVRRTRALLGALRTSDSDSDSDSDSERGVVSIWDAIVDIDRSEPSDPMSRAGRKFDRDVELLSELLECVRDVFGPSLGHGR